MAPAEDRARGYKLADVSYESRDGWRAFADRAGCTPTSLVEVLGLVLGELAPDDPKLGEVVIDVVARARRLTAERRRRDPPPDER